MQIYKNIAEMRTNKKTAFECFANWMPIVTSKREVISESRNVAIYLTRQLRGENLAEICREYGLKTHSSASSAVDRVKGQIIKDRRFSKCVEKLATMLLKRQTETF